jgi:hypothetical protein
MFKGKVNLALVMIVTLGLSACASTGQKKMEANVSGISGTYEIEVTYSDDLAQADHRKFFGRNPDIEFTLTQKGDKVKGEFSGDRNGSIIKGKIDDEEVTFEFVLEAKGGELKDGAGTWIVQEDGRLKGDFNIRDSQLGIVRGRWILTKIE